MKGIYQYLKKLGRNLLFKRSLVHFALYSAALAAFVLLTTNHVITKTPQRVVPAEYSTIAGNKSSNMSQVDLEQLLRSKSGDVTGLVLFDGLKSVIVLERGLEQEKFVAQADIAEMRKLAAFAGVNVETQPSALEDNLTDLLPGWWWLVVMGFIGWFGWIVFTKREEGEEPSRAMVFFSTVPRVMDFCVEKSKMKKTRFYTVLLIGLIAANGVGFGLKLYHDHSMLALPSEIAVAQRIEPWQAIRYVKSEVVSFQRVSLVGEMNAAYLVLASDKKPNRGRYEDDDPPSSVTEAPKKVYNVDRLVVFPKTAAGQAEYKTFVAAVQEKKIENKSVEAVKETGYFDSLTNTGRAIFFTLLILAIIVGATMAYMWDTWKQEETPAAPQLKHNGVGAGGGGGNGGSSTVKVREEDRKTFADVAGCDEAIEELKVVQKKIMRPKLYRVFGAPVPSGIMFYGPPGTGKTLMARALAGEVGGSFQALSGSEFVEMYVGVGAKRVREAYAKARADARRTGRVSFVFIDEIDAIGKKRGANTEGGSREYEQTLNQLLVEMQGFGNHGLVVTIAATNRLDILDEALLRPGRFDIKVKVPKPDKRGRSQIYGVYLKKYKVVLEGDNEETKKSYLERLLDDLGRRSHDFSGAEIEGAIKEGATIAVERQYGHVSEDLTDEQVEEYREKAILTATDLHEGIDKMAYGTQIRSRVRTDKERKATAVHEVGHGAVPTVRKGDPVNRITIVMTDKSLGLMDSSPEEGERYDWTREQFLMRIETMLAGRAAEKIILGKISTGASNDFERASLLARQMVGVYGMSEEFGVKSIPLDQNGFPASNVGETMMVKFNDAWGKIIDDMEKSTDELIKTHRTQIEAVAQVLYEEETLTGHRFRELWDGAASAEEASGGKGE